VSCLYPGAPMFSLLPYTTLFRSNAGRVDALTGAVHPKARPFPGVVGHFVVAVGPGGWLWHLDLPCLPLCDALEAGITSSGQRGRVQIQDSGDRRQGHGLSQGVQTLDEVHVGAVGTWSVFDGPLVQLALREDGWGVAAPCPRWVGDERLGKGFAALGPALHGDPPTINLVRVGDSPRPAPQLCPLPIGGGGVFKVGHPWVVDDQRIDTY